MNCNSVQLISVNFSEFSFCFFLILWFFPSFVFTISSWWKLLLWGKLLWLWGPLWLWGSPWSLRNKLLWDWSLRNKLTLLWELNLLWVSLWCNWLEWIDLWLIKWLWLWLWLESKLWLLELNLSSWNWLRSSNNLGWNLAWDSLLWSKSTWCPRLRKITVWYLRHVFQLNFFITKYYQ